MFLNNANAWDYLVDGALNQTGPIDERWEVEYFNEDQLTLIGDVIAVEILAA